LGFFLFVFSPHWLMTPISLTSFLSSPFFW
jgi:hypothetical protein